ncbi:hypothetical protein HDV00_008217, partial [Rhizophlyctis rosea]
MHVQEKSAQSARTHKPPIRAIIDQSIITALLEQTYSDTRYGILGYLGGAFHTVDAASSSSSATPSQSSAKLIICHVSHIIPSERSLEQLLIGNVEEKDGAFKEALKEFEKLGVQCVGWYRSDDGMKGFQPTRKDLSKQTFLQRTIHPSCIGILTTLASSNNPNRRYPDAPRAPPLVPLQAPSHALLTFRATYDDADIPHETSISSTSTTVDPLYAPTPEWHPTSLYYHNSLKPLRVLSAQHSQPYTSPHSIRQTLKTLKQTLDESVALYRLAAAECSGNPIRRMFLDSEFDAFLMGFWKMSVLGVEKGLRGDEMGVGAKETYEEFHKSVIVPALASAEGEKEEVESCLVPSVQTLTDLARSLTGVTGVQPRIPRIVPVAGKFPDPLLYEADVTRMDRPKRKAVQRQRKKVKDSGGGGGAEEGK